LGSLVSGEFHEGPDHPHADETRQQRQLGLVLQHCTLVADELADRVLFLVVLQLRNLLLLPKQAIHQHGEHQRHVDGQHDVHALVSVHKLVVEVPQLEPQEPALGDEADCKQFELRVVLSVLHGLESHYAHDVSERRIQQQLNAETAHPESVVR